MAFLPVGAKLLVAFLIITIYMKISANGQLAPLTASDQVGNIVLAALAGGTITSDVSVLTLTLSMGLWCMLQLFVRWAKFKSTRLTALMDGKRIQLVKEGGLLVENFSETKLLPEDFVLALHHKEIPSVAEVRNAWYETDGSVTIDKNEGRPLSKALVSNGAVIDGALASINRDEGWLHNALHQQGCGNIKEVFLAEWHDERLWIYPPIQGAKPLGRSAR